MRLEGVEIGPWVRIRANRRFRFEVWMRQSGLRGWRLAGKPTRRFGKALYAATVIAESLRRNPPFTEPLDDPTQSQEGENR